MDKDDRQLILTRARLDDRVIVLRAEHAAGRTDQKLRSIVAKAADDGWIGAIGADHQADAAVGRAKHRGIVARRVAVGFVPQLLLAVLADELAVGSKEHRRIVALLAV